MKPIRPERGYTGDDGYPAAEPEVFSRRGFLRRAAAATAAATGALAGAAAARTAPARRASQVRPVRLDLGYQPVVVGTDLRPTAVDVFTRDPRAVGVLERSTERAGLQQAVTRVTQKITAADLYDGARLYRLERRIASALRDHLRRRLGRAVAAPDVMLQVGSGWRMRTAGVMIRPRYPQRPNHP
jgi:hypothetical protein